MWRDGVSDTVEGYLAGPKSFYLVVRVLSDPVRGVLSYSVPPYAWIAPNQCVFPHSDYRLRRILVRLT